MAQLENSDKKRLQREGDSKTVLKGRVKPLDVPISKTSIAGIVAPRRAVGRKNAAQKTLLF